ncbi:MAG TPA: hypothetical protein VL625_09840, partial [Patescibacteria group bacterium]|nr:hypothetical protein [Patescibacteria group bacterium]
MTFAQELDDIPSLSRDIPAREKRTFFLVFLFDLLALAGAYQLSLWLATSIFGLTLPTNELDVAIRIRPALYSCLSLAALFFLYGNDHYSRRIPWWSQLQQIGKILCFAAVVDVFANYAFQLEYPAILIIGTWLLAFFTIVTARVFLNEFKCRSAGWTRPAVIVAGSDMATDSLYALAADVGLGLSVQAILLRDKEAAKFDREELPAGYRDIDILPDSDTHEDFILRHPQLFYIVCLDSFRDDRRDRLIKLLRDCGIDFALMPAIPRTSMYQTKPRYLFGNDVMLLDPVNTSAPGFHRFLKRTMD